MADKKSPRMLAVLHTTRETLVLALVVFYPQLAIPDPPVWARNPRRSPLDGRRLALPTPAHPVLP
jgi:hypothetical protein